METVAPRVHPTALISGDAVIADDVEIGAYAIIEGPVVLPSGCKVAHHAQILGEVHFGERCTIGHGSIIGGTPQDFSFDPATRSGIQFGSNNVIREHVTIHRSDFEGKCTSIGNDNFLMVGVHLGHDVEMGSHNVIANNCLLAGHVIVGNRCFLGGGAVFHQFIRLGDLSMIQGNARLSQDIPPFTIAHEYNKISGLNMVGMRRSGMSPAERKELKALFKIFYQSGLNVSQAREVASEGTKGEYAKQFIDFFDSPSRKGICFQR